ncbi:MAG: aminopeptidase [Patulibacter minatonensis]
MSPNASYDAAAHAALIADWSLRIEPGDAVLVQYPAVAEPLALAVQQAFLERGAWPALRPEVHASGRGYVDHAHDAQLDAPNPIDVAEQKAATKLLRIYAPDGPDPLAGADPARAAQLARGRQSLRRTVARSPWCLTIFPTDGLAERAELSAADYAAFVHRALMLDRPDPAGAWADLSAVQAELCERLARATTIRIEGDGTDVSLRTGGRHWQNSDGRRNLPSGEVFTGPRERSAKGEIRFTVPSYRPGGVVRGARLVFERGVVVEATADEGEDVLLAELDTDPGARMLGELGIGTSPGIDRPTGSTLLDEKITGTVHLAVGQSYPETGGKNTSAVHWDLICDLRGGGRLTADGTTVMENGRLV